MSNSKLSLKVCEFISRERAIQQTDVEKLISAEKATLTSYHRRGFVSTMEKVKYNQVHFSPASFLQTAIIHKITPFVTGPAQATFIAGAFIDRFRPPRYPNRNGINTVDTSALPQISVESLMYIIKTSTKDPAEKPKKLLRRFHYWIGDGSLNDLKNELGDSPIVVFPIGRALETWINAAESLGDRDA